MEGMDTREWLGVTNQQALRFFFEHLRDVAPAEPPAGELLYNASILAHFATTSTASTNTFPPSPTHLTFVFDVFVMDRSQHTDPDIMEAAGSQCLVLTGFFPDQQERQDQRHALLPGRRRPQAGGQDHRERRHHGRLRIDAHRRH